MHDTDILSRGIGQVGRVLFSVAALSTHRVSWTFPPISWWGHRTYTSIPPVIHELLGYFTFLLSRDLDTPFW